ncbi:hypothetical protein COOONC_13619 [Cooperia oncophora]
MKHTRLLRQWRRLNSLPTKDGAASRFPDDDDAASEREDLDRTHVDAVVITHLANFLFQKNHPESAKSAPQLTEDETPIETAFVDAIRERRRSSVPPIADGILTPPTPPPTTPAQSGATRAVPEFYDHSRHPSIRLKAPSAKKKKMTLLRVEQADVQVELLNGQRIEVSYVQPSILGRNRN